MRKFLLLALLVSIGTTTFSFGQSMSDKQVIEYVKTSQKQGKNQKQISLELAKRGVTKEQAERIKNQYSGSGSTEQNAAVETSDDRTRDEYPALETSNVAKTSTKGSTSHLYGHNIFDGLSSRFEPKSGIATPKNYILGPGDEIIIDVWGASENTIRGIISPDGDINIANIGPVYLNGLTIQEANRFLQKEFSKIYSGISGNTSQIKLSLGQNRSIQVNILGEAKSPGTYTLSSFASVFHALYAAGGVSEIGSMRDIKLVRNNKTIQSVDFYEFILRGEKPSTYMLEDGDVILVPTYKNLVKLEGKIKRPMFYEMTENETLMALLKYGGGFSGDAFQKNLKVFRKNGLEQEVLTVDFVDFSTFRLQDKDSVIVGGVLDRFANSVRINGAVYRPGIYELSGQLRTVKDLIDKAEGVRGDVFFNRVQLHRENEDLTKEIVAINLKDILSGIEADIPLQRNDLLYIPSIHDLAEKKTLAIHGEVGKPGVYDYAENMTVEDLIIISGGLLESASSTKIEIARRVKDPYSALETDILGETFTIDLNKDLYKNISTNQFYLHPFDEVYIRRSPAYEVQQNVAVHGEVLFAGSYALTKKNQRISDVIEAAGGLTSDAFVNGARLIRRMTQEEIVRRDAMVKLARHGASERDSIDLSSLELENTYSVGIDLEKALKKPNSSFDLVLRENDRLYIPRHVSTVKINGAVMYPNTVVYRPGEKLSYYINQAGGYANKARKSRAYVVYLNGEVSRLKGRTARLIEPGCEIVIPTKEERKRMSTGEAISLGTSMASLAAMVASMVKLFK